MSLISIEFAAAFVLFLPLYWLFRSRPGMQNILLTAASLAMLWHYASPAAVLVVSAFTAFVAICSRQMGRLGLGRVRTFWLWLGVVGAVTHLASWKYNEFYRPYLLQALAEQGMPASAFESVWLLPLGISYYTFQGISYLVAVHRGQVAAPRNLSLLNLLHHFGLFLTITSGPIHRVVDAKQLADFEGRPCNALDQILCSGPRSMLSPVLAISLILAGLCKKWWLAGWLAQVAVDPVFANPELHQSADVLAAIYGYTLQLFFDFSGYSDLVVGIGMLLGLRLPVNFRAPLLAHNIREFWSRWHISLSTWIRDHIYLPLGGNRGGFMRTQFNLLVAMGLSGIWHGLGWNFMFWGLAHGVALVLLNAGDKLGSLVIRSTGRGRDLLASIGMFGRLLGIFVTAQFVCMSFVLFRTRSLEEAGSVFSAVANNIHDIPAQVHSVPLLMGMALLWLLYPLLRRLPERFAGVVQWLPWPLRPAPLFIALGLIVLFAPSGIPGFIYANF